MPNKEAQWWALHEELATAMNAIGAVPHRNTVVTRDTDKLRGLHELLKRYNTGVEEKLVFMRNDPTGEMFVSWEFNPDKQTYEWQAGRE